MRSGSTRFPQAIASAWLAGALLSTLVPLNADAQPRRAPRDLGSVVSLRGSTPEDASWPLAEAQRKEASIDFLARLTAPSVTCIYREPGGKRKYQLSFWEKSRPDLARIKGMFPIEVDVAVPACPATWGEAVALGWGNGAWAVAAQSERTAAAERDAEAERDEKRARETPESRKRDWLAQAEALPRTTEASDLELAQQIDAEIAGLESNLDSLNSRPFNDRLVKPGGLFERINRLGQIAYIKSRALNPSPAGRAAFDAWDERLGGPAVSAVARLEKITYYRQYRRVRLAEIKGDAGQQEMASWENVDFTPVWAGQTVLLDVFARHLDGRWTIDPAFQKKIAKDLERLRPSGDPGRSYYYHVPAEPQPSWMMTPDPEDERGGKLASSMFTLASGVGDLMRLIDKVDADVRESRLAFWKCYATRCDRAGETFYAYSYAMWTKDNFYFVNPVMTAPILRTGMAFLGEGSIDGGPVTHCAPQSNDLAGALADAAARSGMDPVGKARGVVRVMKGPVYLAWQGCRDRMEYIMRPRFL